MNHRILIVSATEEEIAPVLKRLDGYQADSSHLFSGTLSGKSVEILVGGIGSVATTYRLTRLLSRRGYDYAVSAGIAGSFADDIRVGEVVQITEDCFADSGIDDNGTFLSLREAGLTDTDEHLFTGGFIVNPSPAPVPYKSTRGITVQTTSGSDERINRWVSKYNPQTETMENAAFFYVCRLMQLPFVSLRAISNRVEPRNKKNWRVQPAIDEVNTAVLELLSKTKKYP